MSIWRALLLLAIAVQAAAQDGAPSPPPAAIDDDAPESEVEAGVPAAAAEAGLGEPLAEAQDEEEAVEEEDLEAEEAEVPSAPAGSNKASMQWVVTAKMRARLTELGYSAVEIEALEPERARAILKHSIARPPKGVPAGWKRGASKAQGGPMRTAVMGNIMKAVRKPLSGVPPVALGSAALLLGGLGALKAGSGGGTAVPAAVMEALEAEPEAAPVPSSNDLWLDRQIDKLIAVLKALLGR